jgi:para-nitrobenzyl esterase
VPAASLPATAPGAGFDARAAALDRLWFAAIRDDLLGALRTQQAEVWNYEFEWDTLPPPFDVILGAAHTMDLPFVFGNFGPSLFSRFTFSRANSGGRLALGRAMRAALGAFVHNGDPNHALLGTAWPRWPQTIVFDADADAARVGTR